MASSRSGIKDMKNITLAVSCSFLISSSLFVSLNFFTKDASAQSTTLAESSEMKVVDGLIATEKGRNAALAAYANLDEAASCVGLTMSAMATELRGGITFTPDDHLYYAILLKSGAAYRDGKGESNEAFSKRLPSPEFVANNIPALKAQCDENFKAFAKAAGF